MNALARWGKFNLVGVIGVVAQLGSLAILNRMMPGHYLVASVVALELTLLHNFVWHVHYTWRDRREPASLLGRCLRFHLSNGMVSLVGNLVLMKVLVAGAGLPVLFANGIAILCCSLVNFCMGEMWVFRAKLLGPKAG
jgi:putative flippase GtrA